MRPTMTSLATKVCVAVVACAAGHGAQAVDLTGSGYGQNFDIMGTTGTTAPAGWTVYTGNSGTSNSTWGTATGGVIPANGSNSVAAMVPVTASLTAITLPTATNNNGYNAANLSPAPVSDRVLATSPTTISGGGLQLSLTNVTGADIGGLSVSYETVRFNAATTVNELPGYWLFYSLDGTTWANVAGLNPDVTSVPNTVGTSSTSGSFGLSAPLVAGGTVLLRWVDDNAQQTSPDQIIGLNNVSVTAVPEPGSSALLLLGLIAVGQRALRRRTI